MDPASPSLPAPAPSPSTPAPAYTPPPLGGGFQPRQPTHGAPEDQPHEQAQQSWLRRKLGAAGAAILAVLAKLKAILLLLPKLKLLVAFGSMAVSILAWGSLYGWTFGIGIVGLLFVHEMGHVIALRREGIPASAPIFIPFLGALISAKSLGDNALAEARVGLAGPILGSLGAVACLIIWHASGNPFWQHLAYFGFFINLFNMIPMSPLDGGRAMAAMAPWMWALGCAAMVVLAFTWSSPIILVFLVLGALDSRRRWLARKHGGPEEQAYYRVSPQGRLAVGLVYVLLATLLFGGLHATYVSRAL